MVNLRWCFSFVQFSELNSKSVTYIIICDFLNKNKMMSLDCMLALQWDRVPEYPELPKTVGFSKRACVCTYWYCSSFRDTKTRFLKSCQIKALDPREKVSPPQNFDQCFSQWQHVVDDLGSIELMQLAKPPCEYRVVAVKTFPVMPVKRNNWCCSQPKYSPIIPWEISYFFKKKAKEKTQGHTKLTSPCR